MRLLQVLSCLGSGGISTVLIEWLRHIQHEQCHVDVCTTLTKGAKAQYVETMGYKVFDLGISPGYERGIPHRRFDLRAVSNLASIVREGKYDIVHTHEFPDLYFSALASCIEPMPRYVYTEHNVFNRRRRYPFLRPLEKLVYQRFQVVTAVSDNVRDALIAWLPDLNHRVVTIPNCVDSTLFQFSLDEVRRIRFEFGLRPSEPLILYSGRFEEAKGVDILIRAARSLVQQGCSFKLLLAGNGTLEPHLRQQVEHFSLNNVVRFIGFRLDLPQILQAADIIVLPSRWEGMPMILLEAMAARTAIVAASVGGISEVVKHNKTGLLVTPNDDALLAHAIRTLIQSPDIRNQLCAAAYESVVDTYSPTHCLQALFGLYRDILNTGRSRLENSFIL